MKKNRMVYTLISVLLGFLVGSVIFLINDINPLEAYKVIVLGAVSKPSYLSWVVVKAIPIILTGISVAFAFRTGLFNIGSEGQYIVGSIGAFVIGYLLHLPPVIHAVFALLVGGLFGGLWGGIVGLLKSRFGINEVISSIMFNWIAFYFSNYMLSFDLFRKPGTDTSFEIQNTANIQILGNWKQSDAGIAFMQDNPVIRQILRPPLNWGLVLAVVTAIVIYYLIKNTTLGYQLKAVGYNPLAAEYGGIDIRRNQVVSMGISGFISGLAGAVTVLGVSLNIGVMASQEGYGFNGMAVALIAGNNPLLCIPAGLLFAGLNYGGGKLNSALNTYSEVVNIVIGIIIFFIAMPKLLDIIGGFFTGAKMKKDKEATK
ncbi:ABC transporter permease [Peptoniphilus equinus]|uniref:ABC transporter permease n=1 Tax=Peptoniphilus equinus TaxID=3016343 RepID=A0ABY7QSE4_9FIRM|nr:ABC transporter permease [Peptoniphilus equinus]WBW49717.1 ABC transporter permease [Peptoniphilus equinus]